MNRIDLVPYECDERLQDWACYFRDYRSRERCKSLEGRYQRHSDDLGEDVSEDVREAPKRPKTRDWVLKAIQVHEALQQLDRQYQWALTYSYCYPSLPKFVVLRLMRKYTGRRMGWNAFRDLVDIGRIRVWTLLHTGYSVKSA